MTTSPETPLVLVVDDNHDAAEVLALLIETEGYRAGTACSLKAARERIVAERPDIVLLDLHLPDGSGMDLLTALKADPYTRAIGVVVLSGLLDDRVASQALALGAAAFLLKPFEHGQLSQALRLARAPA